MTHQLNRVEKLKARKRHRCDICIRWINAGERYFRWTGISPDGDFGSSAYCLGCDVAWSFHERFLDHNWDDGCGLVECFAEDEDDRIMSAVLDEAIKANWWGDA